MARRRKVWWFALPLLALAVCGPSTPRLLWVCKTIAPGTPAHAARASLAKAGAYCNNPELWTTWAASPTCACYVAEDQSGIVTQAFLGSGCAPAPEALGAACASMRVGDHLADARNVLDATGYLAASQSSRGFFCYVSFVGCVVDTDDNDNVLGTSVARSRR